MDHFRVLVTGASGFVAANVVAVLAEQGHDVIALHRRPLDPGEADALRYTAGVVWHDEERGELAEEEIPSPGRVEFVEGDVRDRFLIGALFREEQPTHVVHAAAITPTPELERQEPRRISEINAGATLSLLVESAQQGVQRFVFLSSAAVYAPDPSDRHLTEDAPLRERGGLYALTKIAAERYCRWATDMHGLDTRIVRLGPVYGPWERPTTSRGRMSPVWDAIQVALRGEPLRCNGPWESRDFIHARDAARAVAHVLAADRLAHDTYNAAGEDVFVERMLQAVAANVPGTTLEWVTEEAQANVPIALPVRGPLDSSRLQRDTGFAPQYTLEQGVRETVAWLRRERGESGGSGER